VVFREKEKLGVIVKEDKIEDDFDTIILVALAN
jgi:hypothetical protein